MSTSIKNTLYRFVTLRAPELLNAEKAKKLFIQHPEADSDFFQNRSESLFLDALSHSNPENKSQAFKNVAQSLIPILKSDEVVSQALVSQDFLDFAILLTSKRSSITAEVIKSFVRDKNLQKVDFTVLIKIWDQLFYQIIDQKSSSVRDVLLGLITANFILTDFLSTTDEELVVKAKAKVVIPNIFFEKSVSGTIQNTNDVVSTLDLDKKILVANLQIANDELKVLSQKISKAQKAYQKKTKSDYDAALKAFVKGSSAPIDPLNPPIGKIDGSASFDFTPDDEFDNLNQFLDSGENIFIGEYTTYNGYTTYDEVLDGIQQQIAANLDTIGQNTTSATIAVSNGVITPVNSSSTDSPNSFTITGYGAATAPTMSLLMMLQDDFDDSPVVEANYVLKDQNDAVFFRDTTFVKENTEGNLSVHLFNTNKVDSRDFQTATLSGTFKLLNGLVISFSGDLGSSFIEEFSYVGYAIKGNGQYTISKEGEENNPSDPNNHFVPSEFGIKRVGIADYRKVEQEICCYVPGEVSHIENIMASEYKEKATRFLRKSDTTTTSSTETEREKLTDTTSTDRFEMNQEMSSLVAQDQGIGAFSNYNGKVGAGTLTIGTNFSQNNTTEESNNQAVTHAKELTERALDRLVQKVKEERVVKIVEEFEESNKHGFDNKGNDQHVSGVYRWVDKIYKNKVVNYGKRLMYEFMIPEPASFHRNATSTKRKNELELIEIPEDPRKASVYKLNGPQSITEQVLNYWANKYKVDIDPLLPEKITVSKTSSGDHTKNAGIIEYFSLNDKISIPEGYYTKSAKANSAAVTDGDNNWRGILVTIGGKDFWLNGMLSSSEELTIDRFEKEITYGVTYSNYFSGSITVSVKLERTEQAKLKWQTEAFNAIIEAYEEQKQAYEAKLDRLKATQKELAKTNPLHFRMIENTMLKKNCLEYLTQTLGSASFIKSTANQSFVHDKIDVSQRLDTYANQVKFLEQAFEWDIMSYNFYPFYWADKNKWEDLYGINDIDDPLFKSFLQSGMARVVLTVRPGFEEAINWYMKTGEVYEGKSVPAVDDPMFLTIVEELQSATGEIEETWETRVPTSLTIIQAGSLGLLVDEGLPCDDDCADYKVYDTDGTLVKLANGKPLSKNPLRLTNVTLKGQNDVQETPEIPTV